MKVTRISADGVVEGTGEVLPDREQLKATKSRCVKTGAGVCRSTNMCERCAEALDEIVAGMGAVREYTAHEVAAMRSRAGRRK